MSLAVIEALLQIKIGLDANLAGRSAIAKMVRERLSQYEGGDLDAYLLHLESSPEELEALIESVVVPETWFFRDRESYAFLKQFVRTEWLPAHRNQILRVLSIPCSTGEEPYSIAITLLEAGLTPEQFTIDAVDISKTALERAKRALYSAYSFRGQAKLESPYFTLTSEGYQLQAFIKNLVNFQFGNLVQPNFFFSSPQYHIIFCRNLLIYLVQSARITAIKTLDRLLAPEGILFLGPSETRQIDPERYVSAHYPLAFAFRKLKTAKPATACLPPAKLAKIALPPAASPPQTHPFVPSPQISATPSPILQTPSTETQLEMARSLADRGQLNQAAILCETYLSRNPTSAEAYTLLGQVYQAKGNESQAEQYFAKAVYLNPNDCEALLHLALLKENAGDAKGAKLIHQRIQRLQGSRGAE